MRVLIANDGASDAGGVNTYLRAVCSELRRRNHALAWIHHDREIDVAAAAPDDCWNVGSLGIERAAAVASAWKPDVCFSHNMRALPVERMLCGLAPAVKMMHGYFGTCVSGLKSFAFPGPRPCSRTLGAACLALYFPRRCGSLHPARIAEQYRFAVEQRALFPCYRAIVVASRHMKEEYVRHGATEERVHTIPLFAPPNGGRVSRASVDGTVLFIGRMTASKGGDLLVRAIATAQRLLTRRVPLVMAGDGPERVRWSALASSLSVDARFPGWIDHEGERNLLADASVLAVPSIWPEPFGLVGLEAAASGVPAVAFDVGGISEWLRDGDSGVLAGSRPDASVLATALVRVLGDPALHATLSEGALRMAGTLTIDRHVNALERVLERATSAPRAYA